MRVVELVAEDGTVVCARCEVADNAWTRTRGLLGRRRLDNDEGLLIRKTGSVHTFFMRFPVDVVFCDADLAVLRVVPGLRPWRVASARRARTVVELAAGAAARAEIQPGRRLSERSRPG